MKYKYIYNDGTIDFVPCNEKSLMYAFNHATVILRYYPCVKQIDLYEYTKLIASIYG